MAEEIGLNSIKLQYASIEEAKGMSGLRLILGAYAIPGPWREACKGLFYVKKVPYVPVTAAGKDGSDRELREWTAQASAPVAIWNDERPPRPGSSNSFSPNACNRTRRSFPRVLRSGS